MSEQPLLWHLKKGFDRRFREGHPWVFSNELSQSPKDVGPGDAVELRDSAGGFLAYGVGHPRSLIAFRELSREVKEKEVWSNSAIVQRLLDAARMRERLGLTSFSHRLCFGEADGLPGVIVDRYRLKNGKTVFSMQRQTAGAERWIQDPLYLFHQLVPRLTGVEEWGLVLRDDSKSRQLDGLTISEPVVAKKWSETPEPSLVVLSDKVSLKADLIYGQKTGLFLDQRSNIQLLKGLIRENSLKPERVLDLCCYVGQWGSSLAADQPNLDVTLWDSSESALTLAAENVTQAGGRPSCIRGDVLEDLKSLEAESFNIVIADPPAFIKGRSHYFQGAQAYTRLAQGAIRLTRSGGLVVCCSCSSLLEDDTFLELLGKGARKAHRQVQWIARGSQAVDHPWLAGFPEGRYLKCWIGLVS